ncbi:MAG: methyltransferase domain-containing protein [Nitrospirota bacterium]
MTDFDKTNWARPEFSKQYRDNADIYIVERRRMIEIMRSFYRSHMMNKNRLVLDLGCGDGILTGSLLEIDSSISATLIDPSEDMLSKARERLQGSDNVNFIRASFQDILKVGVLQNDFDFIVSSLAIHHLTTAEKITLYKMIHSHLLPGGQFINIDVILAPTDGLEEWYMNLWHEWMNERKAALGLERDLFDDITMRYKALEENKPDMLDVQLKALKDAGFMEVDCYYKYGIFTVFGGRKE